MADFVPGIGLSESFYVEVVRPALEGVRHSAALIGNGSQVLGYDSARSTDHGWGACVLVFLEDGAGDRPEVETLGVDPSAPIEPVDWVTFTGQSLLEITRGKVFHDGLGTLEPTRRRFADYPEDVWRYLLAAQWCRISQEERLVGRAAEVGDETGSRIIVAERQNALGIGPEVPPTASGFHDRPFRVIHGERFTDSIRSTIRDDAVLALPEHLGAVDQMSDSTDLLSYPALRVRLRSLYGR